MPPLGNLFSGDGRATDISAAAASREGGRAEVYSLITQVEVYLQLLLLKSSYKSLGSKTT